MKPGDGGVLSNIYIYIYKDILNKMRSNVSSLHAVNENNWENMWFILTNLFIVNLQKNLKSVLSF
jgi:hypothetical protein